MLKLLIVIIIIVAAAFFLLPGEKNNTSKTSVTSKRATAPQQDPSAMSEIEKMRAAENYLETFKKESTGIFLKMSKKTDSEPEMIKLSKEYNKAITKYTASINKLQLTCPGSGKKTSSRYRSWTKKFQQKDMALMNECNAKLNRYLSEAGFTRR